MELGLPLVRHACLNQHLAEMRYWYSVTNDFLQTGQRYSKMNRTEPQYNEHNLEAQTYTDLPRYMELMSTRDGR